MENSPAKQSSKITKGVRKEAKKVYKASEKAIKKANKHFAKEAKASSMREERTKRIGIRQGEKTRRVEARNSSPAKQTGETVNTAGQVIPTGIGDAAPNNAFNASVAPPPPNRAGAPPRNTANLNMGIGVDPNTSNFKNNQAANNTNLAGGGNVPGMQVPDTMASKKGKVKGFANNVKEIMKSGKSKEAATKILAASTWKNNPGKMKK